MNIKIYILCFIAGLLGQLFHMGIKIISFRKQAKVANTTFSVNQYLIDDSWPLLLNVLALLIELFILDDIAKWQPIILDYFKFFFIAFGYMGSSLLSAALSKAQEKIDKVVDIKTNIADNKS